MDGGRCHYFSLTEDSSFRLDVPALTRGTFPQCGPFDPLQPEQPDFFCDPEKPDAGYSGLLQEKIHYGTGG